MIARPGRRPAPGADSELRTISLRSRIRRVILGAAGIALLLFAVPLAVPDPVRPDSPAADGVGQDA